MKVLTRSIDGLNRCYNVLLSPEEVEDAITEKLADTAKQVRMDGFRPGKVPMDIVRRMYADSVRVDAIKKLISDTANRVFKDENIKISFNFSTAIVNDDEKGIEFSLKFEIVPKIEIKDFSSLELTKHVAEITDKEKQEILDGIRREHKNWVEELPATKIDIGHKIGLDLLVQTKIKNRDNASIKDLDVIVGDQNIIEGFWQPFIGEHQLITKNITINYPKTMKDKVFAGKTIVYKATVKSVKRAVEYNLDDEFAKSLGYENFEQLNNWAKSRSVARYEQMSNDVLKRDLLEIISEMFDFDIPQNMLAVELQEVIRQISEEAKKLNKEMTDKIKDECNKIAKRRVRLGFVVAEIAKREKISISKKEISDAINNIAAMYPGYEHTIWNMYTKGNSMNAIAGPMLESKVVEFLFNVIKIKEKKCSVAELINLDEEEFEFFLDNEQNSSSKEKKKIVKKAETKETAKSSNSELKKNSIKTKSTSETAKKTRTKKIAE